MSLIDLPTHHELTASVRALAAGAEVDDRDIDRLFPKAVRKLARLHWTTLAVARQASAFLAATPGARVLDIGSGTGKFCLVGALTTRGEFTGIERDGELAAVASGLVRLYQVPRVRFVEGDAFASDWRRFVGLYFYNPFTGGDEPAFVEAVAETTRRLAAQPAGTRVALHHGFGGQLPPGFVRVDAGDTPHLTLWERR